MTSSLSIGKIAQLAAVNPSAIRYWESVGLLPKPERVNGRRRYSMDVLIRIQSIQTAQAAGLDVADLTYIYRGIDDPTQRDATWLERLIDFQQALDQLVEQANGLRERMQRQLEHHTPAPTPSPATNDWKSW